VNEKSNEITAVPDLLRLLEIKGCIITVDALNTQKDIANEIREQGADYMLALKENHPTLFKQVEGIFEAVVEDQNSDNEISTNETIETNRGRTETRRCWSIEAPDWVTGFEEWRDLKSLVLVEATRQIKEQTTVELRYCLLDIGDKSPLFR
jgi:predicted transposase YbfD/YdcC